MKQCRNCQEWIQKDFQYCPVCGENQANRTNKPTNTGVLITIIVLLVFAIVGGIGLYMYKGGAFDIFLENETDSIGMYSDSTLVEIQDIPSELYLTSATFVNNQTVMLELNISRKGNITGVFKENGVSETRTLKGSINKEDGVITIKNDRAAISLILTPTIENAGSYDCTWEYKGKSGISYFYPSEMPKEKPRQKNSDTSSLRNKEESHNTSNANDSTKKQNANIDSVSKKSSGVKPSLKKDNETQTEGTNVKQISE